jgi:DNA-binding SARP family transcriptional activator
VVERGSTTIQLFLLGGVELRGIEREAADRLLAQAKLTALLAVLALAPERRPQRRDRIVGLLWPELDQAHARTALRKGVHALRAALGADALRSRGDEEIGLEPSHFWCDAADLVVAADAGKMQRTVELYRGELMPGFHLVGCAEFERWLDDERTAARERAAAASWGLAVLLEEEGQRTQAGRLAKQSVRYAWDDERVLRRTITMLARIGDHAGALRLYDEFAERMRRELEADPSPETTALVDSLRPSAR